MVCRHWRKSSESKGQHADSCVQMVSQMSTDGDVAPPSSSKCYPQACSLDNRIWPLFWAKCIILFYDKFYYPKGHSETLWSSWKSSEKVFMCVSKYILLLSKGRICGLCHIIRISEIKTFWELLNGRASSIHFAGDLLEDLSSGALLLPGFL